MTEGNDDPKFLYVLKDLAKETDKPSPVIENPDDPFVGRGDYHPGSFANDFLRAFSHVRLAAAHHSKTHHASSTVTDGSRPIRSTRENQDDRLQYKRRRQGSRISQTDASVCDESSDSTSRRTETRGRADTEIVSRFTIPPGFLGEGLIVPEKMKYTYSTVSGLLKGFPLENPAELLSVSKFYPGGEYGDGVITPYTHILLHIFYLTYKNVPKVDLPIQGVIRFCYYVKRRYKRSTFLSTTEFDLSEQFANKGLSYLCDFVSDWVVPKSVTSVNSLNEFFSGKMNKSLAEALKYSIRASVCFHIVYSAIVHVVLGGFVVLGDVDQILGYSQDADEYLSAISKGTRMATELKYNIEPVELSLDGLALRFPGLVQKYRELGLIKNVNTTSSQTPIQSNPMDQGNKSNPESQAIVPSQPVVDASSRAFEQLKKAQDLIRGQPIEAAAEDMDVQPIDSAANPETEGQVHRDTSNFGFTLAQVDEIKKLLFERDLEIAEFKDRLAVLEASYASIQQTVETHASALLVASDTITSLSSQINLHSRASKQDYSATLFTPTARPSAVQTGTGSTVPTVDQMSKRVEDLSVEELHKEITQSVGADRAVLLAPVLQKAFNDLGQPTTAAYATAANLIDNNKRRGLAQNLARFVSRKP